VLSAALYHARELDDGPDAAEASALAAGGIVGVNLTEHGHGWGGPIIELFAIGPAISRDPAVRRPPSPAPVLHLGG
jgi:hypothetical protein